MADQDTLTEPTPDNVQAIDPDAPAPDFGVMKIRDLLLEAKRRIGPVGKGDRNTEQNYDFRGIDAVVNAASPVFTALGILVYPLTQTANYRDVQTSRGKPAREATVTVIYRFEGPVDHLDVHVPGESMDIGDKGTAKAMSVAFRIALLQALMLPTRDADPDSESYQRGDTREQATARDAERPSKDELLQQTLAAAEQVRQLRDESDYASLERIGKYCAGRLGVNVVSKQAPDGPVEEVDLAQLNEGQLTLLLGVIRRSIRDLTTQQQEV